MRIARRLLGLRRRLGQPHVHARDPADRQDGLARFRSVYPGWYQGRTVHIHVKVHVAGNVVHTGQLYFPDSLTDRVFRRKPYRRRGKRTTRNANDFVFAQGGRRSLLRLRKAGSAYVGASRWASTAPDVDRSLQMDTRAKAHVS